MGKPSEMPLVSIRVTKPVGGKGLKVLSFKVWPRSLCPRNRPRRSIVRVCRGMGTYTKMVTGLGGSDGLLRVPRW